MDPTHPQRVSPEASSNSTTDFESDLAWVQTQRREVEEQYVRDPLVTRNQRELNNPTSHHINSVSPSFRPSGREVNYPTIPLGHLRSIETGRQPSRLRIAEIHDALDRGDDIDRVRFQSRDYISSSVRSYDDNNMTETPTPVLDIPGGSLSDENFTNTDSPRTASMTTTRSSSTPGFSFTDMDPRRTQRRSVIPEGVLAGQGSLSPENTPRNKRVKRNDKRFDLAVERASQEIANDLAKGIREARSNMAQDAEDEEDELPKKPMPRGHIEGYPRMDEPLPVGIEREYIIKHYPNHLRGEVLLEIAEFWTPKEIADTFGDGTLLKANTLVKRISAAKAKREETGGPQGGTTARGYKQDEDGNWI